MKHAGPDALARLAPLLRQLRAIAGLKEPRPGVFYRRSKAFLHFHDDPKGLYADVRPDPNGDFERIKIDPDDQGAALIARIEAALTGL